MTRAAREALTVPSRPGLLLRILIGPFAFLAVQIVPLTGLAPEAHLALGSYAWVLAWWAATPIPWAVTGFTKHNHLRDPGLTDPPRAGNLSEDPSEQKRLWRVGGAP